MYVKYFDNAATTKIKKQVLEEMFPYLTNEYGNPSSMYSIGRNSKKAIELARSRVAELINCKPKEIYFTSCGSESDNTAIKGIVYNNKSKGRHIITSKIEHPAILNTCEALEKLGYQISYIGVDKNGIIDLEELKRSITNETILISIMFANNEIGTIQPIQEIAKIAKEKNIIFHTDAVQACGNISIDVQKMGIDLLSMSGHKIHAPKGIGALYVKDGIEFKKFIDGGHQEKDKRAGTENVAGIVGLGKACQISNINMEKNIENITKLRDYLINQIMEKIPDTKLNGDLKKRLPGNCNFSFKGVESQTLLLKLDSRGICVSAGSACSTGLSKPSHVLVAIGLSSEFEKGTIRITLGDENTKDDLDYLIKNLIEIVEELRE